MKPLITGRLGAVLASIALVFSLPAFALPKESAVPGGIALIQLGPAHGTPPRAWLGEQRLWVTAEDGQWQAVVGIPLDLAPGTHEIDVEREGLRSQRAFTVAPKNYATQHIRLKDSSKVTLSAPDEERALAEIAEIQALKRHWLETNDTDTRYTPPAEGRLGSRFGLRRFFNGEARAPHAGLDIVIARGTPVKAMARGVVLATGDYFFNGRTVFIDHGNGLISMVCHLERIDVAAGDTVRAGETVGRSGMTGRASGPHLHWSVVLNGTMVDPELFVGR